VPRCTQPFVHLLSAPQAYLNGIDVPSIFLFKTLVVKLTGSVGAVAGGLAVGKEGPFVHAGASQLMALFLKSAAAPLALQIPYLKQW
jgi:H+/Cl- antiporter ClcA